MLSRLAYLSQQKVTLRHWKDFGGFTGEEFTISMCTVFINRAGLKRSCRIGRGGQYIALIADFDDVWCMSTVRAFCVGGLLLKG